MSIKDKMAAVKGFDIPAGSHAIVTLFAECIEELDARVNDQEARLDKLEGLPADIKRIPAYTPEQMARNFRAGGRTERMLPGGESLEDLEGRN